MDEKGDSGPLNLEGIRDLAQSIEAQLDTLKTQYENQLENLRCEIDRSRQRRRSREDDGSPQGDQSKQPEEPIKKVKELGASLPTEQKHRLESLVSDLDQQYQEQLEDMHQQHVVDVDEQVKAMRTTLEEIYNSQLELMRSELEQSHQTSILDLRETLEKAHKEEMNRLEQNYTKRVAELEASLAVGLHAKKNGQAIDKSESAEFISRLNERLTTEHRQIIKKIESDLEGREGHETPGDVSGSVASVPVSAAEKQGVLSRSEDVQRTLQAQLDEISALRAQMLGEYEQMLSVRAEVMASQSQEVEKLQQEMARIQAQYETQITEFESKIKSQTEASVRAELGASHEEELVSMRSFYENKVSEMTTDMEQLKQEHEELLARLQQETSGGSASGSELPSAVQTSPGKQRDYVRHTTQLTAISDEEDADSPPSTPPKSDSVLESRIKSLESKLKDKEMIIDELRKRVDAETTSAEDLHEKMLDYNRTLEENEENLRAKTDEIEQLRKELTEKDNQISALESEKAALEEKGEKDQESSETGDNKIIEELKNKVKELEQELRASKEVNKKIKDEMAKMVDEHGEAVVRMKEELEKLSRAKIEELEAGFKIHLEEELQQQADELNEKLEQEEQELEIYKQTESELKQQLDSIQTEHNKQLRELKEKYESEAIESEVSEEDEAEVQEIVEVQVTSPAETIDPEAMENLREQIRAEILKEYEDSIDTLKNEYEERISELNEQLENLKSQEILQGGKESSESDDETEIRERLRTELAKEFKDKLQNVTEEYETKLKHLQDIVDGSNETEKKNFDAKKKSSPPYVLARSRSLDRMPSQERSKLPQDYEGYVSTIRREYEERINSLQKEIAQYKSTMGPVPLTPLMPFSVKAQGSSPNGDSLKHEKTKPLRASPDSGTEASSKSPNGSQQTRNEIYNEISEEFSTSFRNLKQDYETKLEELISKLEEMQSESKSHGGLENKIREEYEEKIALLKEEYEQEIAKLKEELEAEVTKLKSDLDKAKADKLAAEKKVKADMFVWHEETVTQLRHEHDKTITQLRKEYEEKMDLIREELQEEFDVEKLRIEKDHRQELVDVEDRYDNLVESLRKGEVPEVAELVREKYDMELEMAKSLMQQENEETMESELSRLAEEKDQEMLELEERHEKELENLRASLLQQYESQIAEMESKCHSAVREVRAELEQYLSMNRPEDSGVEMSQSRPHDVEKSYKEKTVVAQESVDSNTSEDVEEEDKEKTVTVADSTRDKSDKDSDDDKDDSQGEARVESDTDAESSEPAPLGEEHSGRTRTPTPKGEYSTGEADGTEEVVETIVKDVSKRVEGVKKMEMGQDIPDGADSELVKQLREELENKIQEYEASLAQLRASHETEVRQLVEELSSMEANYEAKIRDLQNTHEAEIKQMEEESEKLRDDLDSGEDNTEALEVAHQQELQDLEDRLVQKHMNELNNLETQHQSKLDNLAQEHATEMATLKEELSEAQRVLEHYTDTPSPRVPSFRGGSTLGSTKEVEDFMVRESKSETESEPGTEPQHEETDFVTMETQVFDAHSGEEISEGTEMEGSLQGTLDGVGVVSLDTSMDQSRGTLRGVDTTADTELIQFSDEEVSDRSMDEGGDSQKSDRSTPPAMLQTLGYEAEEAPCGPTVKSLDDTTDSSVRASEREDLRARVRELEAEVEDLRHRLAAEVDRQGDQLERLAREKQEERNLVSMLREDIERLNTDRDALQSTNEHLLGLLSDAVKTYMTVDESITKKMKVMMEKSGVKFQLRPGSGKRTPPPGKKSPTVSPGRVSPARAEDSENPQETSILSNVTDEGLDLSQRISDSIFQGPELASEEEELLIDSGSRLRTSVNHLLEMIEETTSALLQTRTTQADMVDVIEGRGADVDTIAARCGDLEERLKEEVERKDFLALELHKAEGLIEGYSSERETLEQRIQELEEQKEMLVLTLETMKNRVHDLESVKSEMEKIKKEMKEQQDLMTSNVGDEAQALMLEVSRLNSENREKEDQIKYAHEHYESRVRELETSGEDMEHHYGKLLDEKKQEVADLKLQVEALEKQMKAKKQFLEEQSAERDQEHEEYQQEIEKWKKMVQDLEKHNGNGSRLQTEIEELTDQLQSRIDLHNQALLESEHHQRVAADKDLSIRELKTLIEQLEADLQEKVKELETVNQKLKKLEDELSRRPYQEDDLSDSSKSDPQSLKTAVTMEMEGSGELRLERAGPQMTVEEEMRQAANKTKEELVREKFTLQTQVNDNLVQISSLRNQLDEMRHRRGIGETPDAATRLELEREKSEEKDKQIADLKLRVEELVETIENREQQIEQLREHRARSRGSPVEGIEFERDRETERQIEALNRENKQLKERIKLAEASSVADMSGLSQNLIDEKNQEIDHLSEEILQLQADIADLKSEKGIENLYDQVEELREELKLQSVRASSAFTDHSLTPDSSIMNVGASFTEKASIQQEMEESVANKLEKLAGLETELSSMKSALQSKEELVISLETEVTSLREDLQSKDELISALQEKPLQAPFQEEITLLQAEIDEKESLIAQLTAQVDSYQTEVNDLTDFHTKLQEDYETVQNMLEEKCREIESLTKELMEKGPESPSDEHALVIKHEVEIAMLKKDLREKDNIVEEKMEEIAEFTDKIELLESHIKQYKDQVKDYDEQIIENEKLIKKLRREAEHTTAKPAAAESLATTMAEDEKSRLIKEQSEEIESLKEQIQKILGVPPSPPTSPEDDEEDSSSLVSTQKSEIEKHKVIIESLRTQTESLRIQLDAVTLGRPPSPPTDEDGESKSDVIQRLRSEIEKLKQQIMDANLSEDDKFVLIRDLRLENETLKKQIDAALSIKPPSPPLEEDEKVELIREQRKEIAKLKADRESVGKKQLTREVMVDDERDVLVVKQKEEIERLKKQLEEASEIAPPLPPMTEDVKDKLIEGKTLEVETLRRELEKITEAIGSGNEKQLVKDKIEETVKLQTELYEARTKLETLSSRSVTSLQETVKEKNSIIRETEEKVRQLEEDLKSAKEVRAYEDEIELKEKQDEIEELQAELESYRSRNESSLAQSLDQELSTSKSDYKELERSMSFYKEQYEEKCAESRELQVKLDLVKHQLEKARSEKVEDAEEEIELYKSELERKAKRSVEEIKGEKQKIEIERDELKKELTYVKEQLGKSDNEKIETLEKQLETTKDELAKERMDSVQAINDLEQLRDRKERERRGSLKTIQELESDLEDKIAKEKELNTQIRQLSEELTVVKRQYGIEDNSEGCPSRTSPKSGELRSQGSFELGTDVETLQAQVIQYKQHADKAREILTEKQKYQSQVVKLEIQQEQLQKQMKKEISRLEEQLKAYKNQPDVDVWTQLHATQERLEKTSDQLAETCNRLNETEQNLKQVSKDLSVKDAEMRDLQQELWKTSSQLSTTSSRLQETEEKLRHALGQVTEREDQIHQLQGELQHTQLEADQSKKTARTVSQEEYDRLQRQLKMTQHDLKTTQHDLKVAQQEVERSRMDGVTSNAEETNRLRRQLQSAETELEEVKKSLKEAVDMSEQQLAMGEAKDEEYVKLKLGIQQTIGEKDKMIREQRSKLKEKEQEVTKVKSEVKEREEELKKIKEQVTKKEKEAAKTREEAATQDDDSNTISTLRAQLRNQEEVILSLETDLSDTHNTIREREQEIDDIHHRNAETRNAENETVEAMHHQISQLQMELQELRSLAKAQDQRSSPLDEDRGQPNAESYERFDDRGEISDLIPRRQSPTDGADLQRSPEQGQRSPDERRRSPDATCLKQGQTTRDQEDSGHQSFEPSLSRDRCAQYSPEGQSLSPQQLRPHFVDNGAVDFMRRHESSQSYVAASASPPTRDRPLDHHLELGQFEGQRSSKSSSKRSSPVDAEVQVSDVQRKRSSSRSPPSTEIGLQHDDLSQGQRRSPGEGHRSLNGSQRSASQRSSQKDGDDSERRGQRKSQTSRRSSAEDEQGSPSNLSPSNLSPSNRRSTGSAHDTRQTETYSLNNERLVYEARPAEGFSDSERYIGDNGQLYDRDGNIRPRYSQSESQSGRDLRTEGQGHHSDAEKYIQQLRRELLITKTALMQIQRGARLEDAEEEQNQEYEFSEEVMPRSQEVNIETLAPRSILGQGDTRSSSPSRTRADALYQPIPDERDMNYLRSRLERTQEELELYRNSSNLSARDFVQKVMSLKDELSNEHQRHIQEMARRSSQDTETQLAAMRIKYTDEIEHIKRLHAKELQERLNDLQQMLDRRHKSETSKMVMRHQEEVGTLKSRAGLDFDESVQDRHSRQRQEGTSADRGLVNGHASEPMSQKLQSILRRLHTEGVNVLTISELDLLNRSQSQGEIPRDADIESMKAGFENERQSMISTIQSLKDLLAQTHKLRGLDKDDDDDDDDDTTLEGSDWRAELLRAIGYTFAKEREALLAELRSHVLCHPSSNVDEVQRLEQRIRNMGAHHHSALDQIFGADRQSMLAEIRDLRAHATIARMQHNEERERLNEKVTHSEESALKKERQLKRQVQLLEFKIQQEKVLQDDLRTSLDSERNRSSDLATQLNCEKSANLDLQTAINSLQGQVAKLREGLEREQSRYVSVTNALEEEKSKSLNLSDLLESERQTLWRVQAELQSLKQQQSHVDPRAIQQLQSELQNERDLRCRAESQIEIDVVTIKNVQQELEMVRRHQHATEVEVAQLQQTIDRERQKQGEITRALEHERARCSHLQQCLEVEKSQTERLNDRDQVAMEDLIIQLKAERANVEDLRCAYQREQASRDEMTSERNMLKEHISQERALSDELKQELEKVQFERLEAVNKLQKEREQTSRFKSERDQVTDELRQLKSRESQREQDQQAERAAIRNSARDADREKEEYRMKLHEQELENQRKSQKIQSLEEQLADSQENELRAVRELEKLKIDLQSPVSTAEMVSVQTSPRRDERTNGHTAPDDSEMRERCGVYRSQLESMCQSLHYLILRCREQLHQVSQSGPRTSDLRDFDALHKSLRDLLHEVKQLQEMEGDFMSHPSGSVNERILRQNEELTNFIARISEEKLELRNTLSRLEDEIWRYRQVNSEYEAKQRTSEATDGQVKAQRAEWAKEKLSLQMALNSAEREIGLLQTDLRVERERRVAAGITETRDNDKIKIQRIYGKYLRAESFRKALIYQKKYLLVLLGGFQDTEETTLAMLSRMGALDPSYRQGSRPRPITKLRGAVRVVIAVQRMKFLVKKWRRATRVGSEVVGGSVDQSNGYVPNAASYSPPRQSSASRIPVTHQRSSSSPPTQSSFRQPSPSRMSGLDNGNFLSPRYDTDSYSSSSYHCPHPQQTLSHVPSTPPTKDYSSTTNYTSPSSGARRKILTSSSIPAPSRAAGSSHVRFSSTDDANALGESDDYISRLENLQSRLGSIQNGKRSSLRQAWR